MNDFKLTLLRKWEFDNEFSFVYASTLLPNGTAVILTSDNTDWHKYYVLFLSTEGVKKIPIEYNPTSNRDYPMLFRYKEGFAIIISAEEVRYYSDMHSSPALIPIKNKSLLRYNIVPEKAEQRYFQNISDSQTIPVCFENEVYYGNARCFALLEFDEVAKTAKWKSFSKIDKKAFTHCDNRTSDTPKIDSLKISDKKIYAFIPGESASSVNKWGMDYYALAQISAEGKVIEKIIESDNLHTDHKKRGVNGCFTDSEYVILTPVFKTDDWKGNQKVFSLTTREYSNIFLPKGMTKHKLQNITGKFCLTSLFDRGLKEISLCNYNNL
ncbi:hypothetical protein CAPGI0001_0140 [Capnocytophaga gingivalis ATCC 33624]|uniref:hypothetical protein n=1 Tax=Capnocytophaga gingivalis TaxID=1017 RepID=UPI00019FB203|nr:hypothetical protein [Capnocytophaga gingivalis]EEK14062.1 hypothetical protein CAPGI0001_0140 [Capnocytophaga gingivalis ATCC 33624]